MSEESEAEVADDADEPAADPGDAEEAEPGASDEEAEASGIQDGDFVRLSYTIWTLGEEMLVDTTDEDLAEEEGIDTEDQDFGPRTLVIGAGHVFDAVESELEGKAIGDTGTVEITAAEAFGEHDPEQVRTVSADRIPEDQRHPGGHVDIDGQHGHVETIIGGRARVDFNHPLAGEDITYEYEILDVVEDRLERAQGLLDVYLDIDLDMHIETDEEEQLVETDEDEDPEPEPVELETLYIESTPQLAMNQQWLFQKQQIAQELIDRIGVDRVIVREILDGTGGMMGGLGGMGGLEDAIEDIDEDIDTEELLEDIESETDLDADLEIDEDTEE